MNTSDLVSMMFENEPIETFKKLIKEDNSELEWGKLLDMCCCEKSYESVGGDYGYKKNPPINNERIAYLEKLIAFLEQNGIKSEK